MSTEISATRHPGSVFWLWWIIVSIRGAVVFLIVALPLSVLFAHITPDKNAAP
jgi:hypothetical protein